MIPGKYFARKLEYVVLNACKIIGFDIRGYFGIPASIQGYFAHLPVNYKSLPPIDLPFPELISDLYSKNGQNLKYMHCETLNIKSTVDILQSDEAADTLIVCISETDRAGHILSPMSDAYQAFLFDFDERLSHLFNQVECKWPFVKINIFSDHGMSDVYTSFDIWTFLEKHGYRLGKEYIAFINSTITSFWFNKGHKSEIVGLLNHCGAGRVLTHEERIRFHLDFSDRKYGDEIFVVDEGVELIPNFLSLAWKPNLGMHGYDPIYFSTKAFFIGNKDYSVQLKNVVDIYSILKSHCK